MKTEKFGCPKTCTTRNGKGYFSGRRIVTLDRNIDLPEGKQVPVK